MKAELRTRWMTGEGPLADAYRVTVAEQIDLLDRMIAPGASDGGN